MKKITAYLIIFVLLFSFVACGESNIDVSQVDDSTQSADSSLALQDESSKPRDETTVPDSHVSDSPESSSPQESVPEESVPEESLPEESVPEESDDEYEWSYSKGFVPFSAAKGYKIVYTKVKPINALSCFTDGWVTAVYDGRITRFFNSRSGEYYCAELGEFALDPGGSAFCPKPKNQEINDWNVPMIYFEMDYANNKLLNVDYDFYLETGYGSVYNLYDGDTGIIYYVDADDDGTSYGFGGEGLFTCTLWEDLSTKKVYDFFETDAYQIFKEELPSKKFGLVTNESIVIPFEYDYISDIEHSTYEVGVVMAVKDGKTYYFASDGTNLTPEGFDCGTEPVDNRAWVFEGGNGWIIEFN